MKKHFSTISLIFVFLVGLSVLLYPTVSDYINKRNQSVAVGDYDSKVSEMTEKDYSEYFDAARDYNERLFQNPDAFFEPDEIEGYDETLDISGTGIMGYVTIQKIDVELPIYHGTSDVVLQIACGHLEGSSLPIGGQNTHCVLSAHRGLPSAKLFTNLDELEIGDTFTVTVLDQVLTYQVDNISIVLPSVTEGLQIEEGKDYCTLMTCTPYGINSERLLVRGHRIETTEEESVRITSDAVQIEPMVAALALAVPMLLVLLLWLLLAPRKGGRNEK